MKLLFCEECSTIFNLSRTPRTCDCGKCGGQYLPDGINAEYFGPAVVFGIDNTSFLRAAAVQEVWNHEDHDPMEGAPFDAFIIPAAAPTVRKTDHDPNTTTRRTFAATDRAKGLTRCADAEEMFKKLGI